MLVAKLIAQKFLAIRFLYCICFVFTCLMIMVLLENVRARMINESIAGIINTNVADNLGQEAIRLVFLEDFFKYLKSIA